MLTETYRPKDWPDVVGHGEVTAKLARWESEGTLSGRAYWISGKSGNGKTTIARIIAAKLSDQWYTAEMDASELTSDSGNRPGVMRFTCDISPSSWMDVSISTSGPNGSP